MDTVTTAKTSISNEATQSKGEDSQLCGLNFARSLGFTDEQSIEALKRIDRPDNVNQLLVALIDVSGKKQNQIHRSTSGIGSNGNEFGNFSRDTAREITELTPSSEASSLLSIGSDLWTATSIGTNTQKSLTSSSTSSTSLLTADQSLENLSTAQHQNSPFASSCSSQLSLEDGSLVKLTLGRVYSNSSTTTTDLGEGLRKIYVDGSNVARTHGKDAFFSWVGIEICVEWFRSRNHLVRVLVPEDKLMLVDEKQQRAINHLEELDVLVKTPNGHNDDLIILEAAKSNDGIIVSNDQFRDERMRSNFSDEMHQFVLSNRLSYVFVDDLFIPSKDPLGRAGPNLEEFLRINYGEVDGLRTGLHRNSQIHQKLCKAKSHQAVVAHRLINIQRNYPRANNGHYRHIQQQDYRSQRQIRSWQGPERPIIDQQMAARPSLVSPATYRPQNQQHQRKTSDCNLGNQLENTFNKMRGNLNSFWQNQRKM